MLSEHVKQASVIIKLALTSAILFILCACGAGSAINRTENIQGVWPAISYTTDKNISIQVTDKRPYVLNNKVNPTYIGVMRGGFGNPFNMNTESGQPLATDVAIAINNGFNNSGIKSIITDEPNANSASKVKYRRLELTIYEWESDYYKTADFKYNLELKIFDAEGKMLASDINLNINDKHITVQSPIDAGRSALSKILNSKLIVDAMK